MEQQNVQLGGLERSPPQIIVFYWANTVFVKCGYVYPWGYSEVLQGVLEREWNTEKNILLLLNDKTLTHLCEHAALLSFKQNNFERNNF